MTKRKDSISYSTRERLPEDAPEYRFADRLKAQMKKKHITQKQLAEAMNVSIDTVRDWCQHYTFPSQLNLGMLCEIFAPCSADYFHGIIEEPSYDVKFVMEYTGLSKEAVVNLHKGKINHFGYSGRDAVLNLMLSDFSSSSPFIAACDSICDARRAASRYLNHNAELHLMEDERDGKNGTLENADGSLAEVHETAASAIHLANIYHQIQEKRVERNLADVQVRDAKHKAQAAFSRFIELAVPDPKANVFARYE